MEIAIDEDIVNDCIEKMIEADGIILASPTYFADVLAEMKALIDQARSGIELLECGARPCAGGGQRG
jgi:multimeric flavodoxin WrbA